MSQNLLLRQATVSRARTVSRVGVLSRARARRRSDGAAMFIVAVTLGLLAAMGVYGMTATAADVRASGHGRQAAQGQHAAELAIVMTSQLLEPGNAQVVVNRMRADKAFRESADGKQICRTARPVDSNDTQAIANRDAQACLVLTPTTMKGLAQDPASFPVDQTSPVVKAPFSPQSFGEVPTLPFIRVELTNPIDWDAPAGNAVGRSAPIFTQVRATVFVEMRPTDDTLPAESIASGRGRLVVGPYLP